MVGKPKVSKALAIVDRLDSSSLVDRLQENGWLKLNSKIADALYIPLQDLIDFTDDYGELCLRADSEYLCAPDFFRKVTPKFAAAPQDDYMILRSKLEDLDARDKVIKQYENLVHKIANRKVSYYKETMPDHKFPPYKDADFEQMGRLGVLKAIIRYDWSASFMTFTYICITNTIWSAIRKVRGGKDILASADSLDEPIRFEGEETDLLAIDTIPSKGDFGDELYQSQVIELLYSEIGRMGFTSKEKNILECRVLFDYTLDELGTVYGVSRESIRQVQDKLTKRLRLYSPALRAAFEKHSSEH